MSEPKHFCLLPWTHLHVWPTGDVLPCCSGEPIGHLKDATLEQIWNERPMREIRRRMLANEPNPQCARCYELEAAGFQSQRRGGDTIPERFRKIVKSTTSDGRVPKFKLPTIDIRFSNVCNFRCRTCGPELSSSWAADFDALKGKGHVARVLRATEDPQKIWKQVEAILDDVEEIYFAGGEPLLMEEHYRILERLIARKRFDVRLTYNTNFSETTFKEHDVFEMWSRFSNVLVGASLDASGARGEYIRKGQKWDRVVANRERMLKVCPTAKFYVASTVSVYNVFELPQFHREWVEAGYIDPAAFTISVVTNPAYLRAQLLPGPLKAKARELYQSHIDGFLKKQGPFAGRTTNDFKAVLRFLDAQDLSHRLPEFISFTQKLDLIRGERFSEVFPELASALNI